MSESFLSISEAAELIGKSEATILRYKRNGVNVHDRDELLRHSQLKDIRTKGAAKRKSGTAASSVTTRESDLGELPEAGSPGAAPALKRLQDFEVEFAQRLKRALNAGDPTLVQVALDDHAKISQTLLRYEREVEESKRDLGHLN